MDEHTFNKLAEILRPTLERNEYYVSEKRERYGERERESRSHEEFCVVFANPTLLDFPTVSCGTTVQLECHEQKLYIFCGTAVQLECHEKNRRNSCGTTAVQL